MKTSLIIDLAGNLQSRSRQYAQALTGLSETGRRSFAALRSSAVSLGRGIDAVSNRYTAAIAGMGATWKATQAVMHSASLDKQLARITRTAGVSRAAGESLRRELYALSEQTGQSVDELLQGFSSLVQSGQSYDEALATTRALAPAMAVTGASAETLSSAMTVAAQNFKFDLSDVKMAKLLLDQMTKAGDLGNAELEHLADIFARVGGNARNAGLSMTDTLALIEQMSLVEKQPERLATLVDSTLRLWNNENYRKQAEKVTGVKFFDEKGNRRNAFDILAEMSAKYGKFTTDEMRSKGLFAAFGKTDLDTQRGIAMMLQQGIPAAARDMAGEIQRSGGLIEKALPDAIANSVDQVARLKAALGDAADSFARPVNDAIEKGIKFILDEQGIGGKELLVGGTAAALGGAGLLKLAGGLMARAGGGALASAAGKLGGGFGRLPLPLPVYVVNNRMSLTNDALSDMVNGKPTGVQGNVKTPGLPGNTMTGKARAGAKAGATAAKVAAPLAILDGAISVYDTVTDDKLSTQDKVRGVSEATGGTLGSVGGAWAGAAAGAAIGSVVPVIGTAIGGALGALLGGWFGGKAGEGLGSMVGDALTGHEQAKALGAELAAQNKTLAQDLASETTVRVVVEGPADASITRSRGPASIDVYSAGLSQVGAEMMGE